MRYTAEMQPVHVPPMETNIPAWMEMKLDAADYWTSMWLAFFTTGCTSKPMKTPLENHNLTKESLDTSRQAKSLPLKTSYVHVCTYLSCGMHAFKLERHLKYWDQEQLTFLIKSWVLLVSVQGVSLYHSVFVLCVYTCVKGNCVWLDNSLSLSSLRSFSTSVLPLNLKAMKIVRWLKYKPVVTPNSLQNVYVCTCMYVDACVAIVNPQCTCTQGWQYCKTINVGVHYS